MKSELGIATLRISGGVALSMRHDVTGYWSKALGFGFEEPVTEELIGRVLAFYRAERTPGAVIQIAPLYCLRSGTRFARITTFGLVLRG